MPASVWSEAHTHTTGQQRAHPILPRAVPATINPWDDSRPRQRTHICFWGGVWTLVHTSPYMHVCAKNNKRCCPAESCAPSRASSTLTERLRAHCRHGPIQISKEEQREGGGRCRLGTPPGAPARAAGSSTTCSPPSSGKWVPKNEPKQEVEDTKRTKRLVAWCGGRGRNAQLSVSASPLRRLLLRLLWWLRMLWRWRRWTRWRRRPASAWRSPPARGRPPWHPALAGLSPRAWR